MLTVGKTRKPEPGHREVEKNQIQLDQQRRVAHQLDIAAGEPAEWPAPPWASAMRSPQTRQIAIVSLASSTVTAAPSSNAGIGRAMKWGSNGTSIFVVIVEALRGRVLLHPLMVPLDIFLVAGAGTQFANPGVEEQPPLEIAGLQKNRIPEDKVPGRPRDVEPHQIVEQQLLGVWAALAWPGRPPAAR
jgi:hypothetical protein